MFEGGHRDLDLLILGHFSAAWLESQARSKRFGGSVPHFPLSATRKSPTERVCSGNPWPV